MKMVSLAAGELLARVAPDYALTTSSLYRHRTMTHPTIRPGSSGCKTVLRQKNAARPNCCAFGRVNFSELVDRLVSQNSRKLSLQGGIDLTRSSVTEIVSRTISRRFFLSAIRCCVAG